MQSLAKLAILHLLHTRAHFQPDLIHARNRDRIAGMFMAIPQKRSSALVTYVWVLDSSDFDCSIRGYLLQCLTQASYLVALIFVWERVMMYVRDSD